MESCQVNRLIRKPVRVLKPVPRNSPLQGQLASLKASFSFVPWPWLCPFVAFGGSAPLSGALPSSYVFLVLDSTQCGLECIQLHDYSFSMTTKWWILWIIPLIPGVKLCSILLFILPWRPNPSALMVLRCLPGQSIKLLIWVILILSIPIRWILCQEKLPFERQQSRDHAIGIMPEMLL